MENEIITEQNYVEELLELIRSDATDEKIRETLDEYHENDIAGAFEQLNESERKKMYRILTPEQLSEIFAYIEDAGEHIAEMPAEMAAEVIGNMDSDEAVEVLEDMDDEAQKKKLVSLLFNKTSANNIYIVSFCDFLQHLNGFRFF